MCSDNKTLYLLQGVNRPEGKDWKEVKLVPVSESEFNTLTDLIKNEQSICADKNELNLVRTEKIQELSIACRNSILNGVSVLFKDQKYHTFELTLEDQLNLMMIDSEIRNGAKEILYHEKNKVCQIYSAEDIQRLLNAVNEHKTYHTTYFNILKCYVHSLHDINIIKNIQYGMKLPEEYHNKLNGLLN
jgi:hypothetical protein